MNPTRRNFLQGLVAATLIRPAYTLAADNDGRGVRLLGCRDMSDGRHLATLFDSSGNLLLDVPLPGRGHGFAVSHDQRSAVVFARRPRDFLVVIDLVARRERLRVTTPADRHSYGHGTFSVDDRLLYATENAFESGVGVIGIYDTADNFRRIGELPSHGIGPHALRLAADGNTLIVANGGIRTHPDMPRAKLNLQSMRSSLAYVDGSSGELLERHGVPEAWTQLSIRHIDVATDATVAIAMQYEGGKTHRPPLVALHRRGESPRWLEAPPSIQRRMRNYCGSVAFAADGHTFAVSSPRGGIVTEWSSDGQLTATHEQVDACGLARGASGLWASDGHGGLQRIGKNAAVQFPASRWDNHLATVNQG